MDQPLSALRRRADPRHRRPRRHTPGGAGAGVLRSARPGAAPGPERDRARLLAFFAYLVLRAIEPPYTLLYGSLELDDSAQIISRLEASGVPFRLQGDGSAIMVPADQALRLRMTLAEEGLPRGGTVGDEIFDQSSALGTTNFLANVNLRRALEGELARTIGSLADVRAARVHLVLPRHELFRRDQIEPSASITLRMRGSRAAQPPPGAGGAASGRRRRARAWRPSGSRWSTIRAPCSRAAATATRRARCRRQAEEYREAYEARLKRTIEHLLERSLGPGRVHAEVSAELDFDRVTLTEETFDPEGQVVRSTQTVEEETENAERDDDDAVTVGNNLPNAAADTPPPGAPATRTRTRTEETVNYEISRTVRNQTQVGGRVRRLSVAVLVDGRMTPDEAGELVYRAARAPRSWPRSTAWCARRSASTKRAATWSRSGTCRSRMPPPALDDEPPGSSSPSTT